MNVVALSAWDLALAAALVLALAALSLPMGLAIGKQLVIAGVRTVVQLLLVGLVLNALFDNVNFVWIALIAIVMLLVAAWEAMARQRQRLLGWWGFGVGSLSMFVSTFSITILVLLVIIDTEPWYAPRYAIPLLGMMLGNTMTGIALALDRLTQTTRQQRGMIENRLMLGHTWKQVIEDIRNDSMRSGMIPTVNAMAVAGIVSLPGMMTGQILAGTPPFEAVKYQILIMFMIAGSTGFGTIAAVYMAARRFFDDRGRLRLERISEND